MASNPSLNGGGRGGPAQLAFLVEPAVILSLLDFIDAFELVFGSADWDFTREHIASEDLIRPSGNFLEPGVPDESNNWANRASLLSRYRRLKGELKKPQFDLIARQIAERLVGEELFDGLGPCEIVADPTSRNGTVELMTAPTRVAGNDIVFSMAAHLSVFTLPYSAEVYLRVSAVKRVWATKVPGRKPNAPPTVKGYIIAPNKPILI